MSRDMCPRAATYLALRRDGYPIELRDYLALLAAVEDVYTNYSIDH